jgi:hypothetical protein
VGDKCEKFTEISCALLYIGTVFERSTSNAPMGIRRNGSHTESAMNSTYRPNTETLEPFKAKCTDRTEFDQRIIHPGTGPDASEAARIAGGTGKKLFCRLPRPVQQTLQAHLTGGGPEPAD